MRQILSCLSSLLSLSCFTIQGSRQSSVYTLKRNCVHGMLVNKVENPTGGEEPDI